MLIEKAYAIGVVATVVSGTLFRTINDGDEVLVKTAEGSIYTSQVSGLKIWHGYINKPALCANKDDAVSFRLRKINVRHISIRDKIFVIR